MITTIKGFSEAVAEQLKGIFGTEYDITSIDAPKNNGKVLHGISIRKAGDSIAPAIYLESLFEAYMNGRLNVSEAVNEVLRAYSKSLETPLGALSIVGNIERFDWAKDKIVLRLVNARKNEALLKEVPHREFLDLAVIYCIMIAESATAGMSATVTIKNELMEMWGVTEDDLYDIAMVNTPNVKAPVVEDLESLLRELVGEADQDVLFPPCDELQAPMTVVTTEDRCNGDVAILYPGVLEDLAKKQGGNLFLLPSSIHEFIAVPATLDPRELAELVQSVNCSVLEDTDYLSDAVYLYDLSTRKISVA